MLDVHEEGKLFSTPSKNLMNVDVLANASRLSLHGSGPGGPLPFRIYVDSGSVFLCVVALAPACPMVAPAGML